MKASPFDVSVRTHPGMAVLDLSGEIDSFAEKPLAHAYAEVEAADPRAVLLNFTDVAYINSTGIALIVGVLAKARTAQRQVFACGLSEHYVEIFNITRLADFMTLFPDEAAALSSAPSL